MLLLTITCNIVLLLFFCPKGGFEEAKNNGTELRLGPKGVIWGPKFYLKLENLATM